eukprot:CAMPEP_0197247354 /NCGR_PEP_ID=MMETSP1429-20130617/29117_1 /TAXON_ID=49237 /ORGANISM="Chaetoceros  sp., Strain UNC1202" /LENGTH=184 /DNA_ID=CAMNT_0042708245 /DNA_START=44 /DNA_END=598 /DNA_ORIENTATION=-
MKLSLPSLLFFIASSVNANEDANTALLDACNADRGIDVVADVKAALANGADINTTDGQSGQTCLMAASLRGKINIATYLLGQGADTTIGEMQGYTPPHGAAFQGRPDVMKLLADSGVNVNMFHDDGFLPLHRVCWGSSEFHTETLKVLIDLGIDPKTKSRDGKTCRDMTNNEHVLEVLDAHAEL